ncbi:MAG: nuclear transport factor 2 family protein [Phycisphaerae bacterium]
MEWLTRTFFESPTLLYALLVMVEGGLLARWVLRRGRRNALALLVPIAVGLGLFALERVVQTDREKILAAAEEIASAASGEADLADVLDQRLRRSDEFRAAVGPMPVERDEIIEMARTRLHRADVREVRVQRPEVTVEGDRAKMNVATVIFFGEDRRDALIWDLVWIREEGRWRILTISPPKRGVKL